MSTEDYDCITDLEWLKINKGQGEIHISLLAEAMWDAMNESTPKELKAGEWHIPFSDKMDILKLEELYKAHSDTPKSAHNIKSGDFKVITGKLGKDELDIALYKAVGSTALYVNLMLKIATARCARVSYLNFEGKDDYEADIKLYDILKSSGHYSPFEHCARAMTEDEMLQWIRFVPQRKNGKNLKYLHERQEGWSGNFRGFVQLRKDIE